MPLLSRSEQQPGHHAVQLLSEHPAALTAFPYSWHYTAPDDSYKHTTRHFYFHIIQYSSYRPLFTKCSMIYNIFVMMFEKSCFLQIIVGLHKKSRSNYNCGMSCSFIHLVLLQGCRRVLQAVL